MHNLLTARLYQNVDEFFFYYWQMSSHRSDDSTTNDNTGNSLPSPNSWSPVWEYYEPELIDEDGVLKSVCKYCGSKMTAGRKIGTTSLRNHIAEYCSKIPSEVRKKFVATMKKPIEGPFVFDFQKKPRVNDYLVH